MEIEVRVVDAEEIPVGEGRKSFDVRTVSDKKWPSLSSQGDPDDDDERERDGDGVHSNVSMYSIQSRTGFGRPTTLGVVRHTTIYLYEKYGEVYPKLCELARLERKSFSELMSIAAKEYVETHYPGNPQLSLMSFTADGLKPKRLEAKIASQKVKHWLEILENPKADRGLKNRIRTKDIPPLILKLAKVNQRLRDEEVSELVDRGEKECFGEGCV